MRKSERNLPMNPRKKLIEVSIPLEAINVASAREKSMRHGHPSTLHLWWARRPLAACRAVLFAQLVDDPSAWPERFNYDDEKIEAERRRLHRVIEAMVPWEASNDELILTAARWEIARSVAWGLGEEPPAQNDGPAILDYLQTKAPPVYDPFSGGGSIPLEAQRLGLRAYGSDLNPVAVLIGKALVEIPPKFAGRRPINPEARAMGAHGEIRAWKGAQGLAEDVRYYGRWMRDEAQKRIGHLYPRVTLPDGSEATVISWLWARTVRSPDPSAKGAMVPLVSSFMLSTKDNKKAWAEPVIDPDAQNGYRFDVKTGNISNIDEDRLKKGTRSGKAQAFVCLLTQSPIERQYIQDEGKSDRLGIRLLGIIAEGPRGRAFTSADALQEAAAASEDGSNAITEARAGFLSPQTPTRAMITGGVCSAYGLRTLGHLFTPRQIVALTTLSDLVGDIHQKVCEDALAAGWVANGQPLHTGGTGTDAYADAIATYVAFMVTQLANHSSSLCGWNSVNTQMRSVFARQSMSMTWDFAEVNVFSQSSGSFNSLFERMVKAFDGLPTFAGPGYITASDARDVTGDGLVFSTDPPYYDNIAYAVLSDFFYVWLKRSLNTYWPDLFRRLSTPKAEELVVTAHQHGGRINAEVHFLEGMGAVLRAICHASADGVPLVVYYAFKQSEQTDDGVTSAGWAAFLQAIVDAGLGIDGTWPLDTEKKGRSVQIGANALASSVVLVCRKRSPEADVITRADFIRTLKREMPSAIDAIRKAGVGPVDMQQSVIGPGMGVFSRHARVLEDDDSSMGVKTALALINRVWEEIENELDQAFDAETQVALAWFATYGFDARASGELITLANAKNTSSSGLFTTGVFKDMRGKAALTPRNELPAAWSPTSDRTLTVWECVQHTARVINAPDGGGAAAAALVAQMGPKSEEARALAYRLFEIATNKGWAAEALVYNELAQEWTKLEDIAATLDDTGQAPRPGQSAFAFEGTA
jgi:putative DNA methylase